MLLKVKNRWQAFGIHLCISLIILFALLCVLLFWWFPGIFINAGGYQGIKIVTGVDLVLGPLLTLAVFNPTKSKKHITIDLFIIGAIQFFALFAGLYLVHHERPLFQVLSDDGLYIYTSAEYKDKNLNSDFFNKFTLGHPRIAFLKLPENEVARKTSKVTSLIVGGEDITLNTDLYLDFSTLSQKSIQARMKGFTFEESKNCYMMPLTSSHVVGKTCFDLKKGAVELHSR